MMKTLLIVVGVIVLLLGGYVSYGYLYPAEEVVVETVPRADLPGADIIAELDKLPVDLDGRVFSSVAYRGLTDGTIVLQDLPSGRPNPFLPIFSSRGAR